MTWTAALRLRTDRLARLAWQVQTFLAKGPVYHYTYGTWRVRRWLGRRLTRHSLSNRSFLSEFALGRPDLTGVVQAIGAEDEAEALARLSDHFRKRTTPYFFFSAETLAAICALVEARQVRRTVALADEVCHNRFHFRGVSVCFEAGIDWAHQPEANIDWRWDLNRHVYFETLGRAYAYTGDERYAAKFRSLLLDWLEHNPAGVNQPNWSSVFEVAFRINTWLWAFYYFRSSPAFDGACCRAFLEGLLAHGRFLDAHLELHAQNNHLLLEAKALAMLGLVFPEFRRAERWRRRGLDLVYRQVSAQVCPDGVHGERVTHYQRVINGELLELLVLLEANAQPVPGGIRETFGQMLEFELWITKPNGQLPLLGDSALEDTHHRFSAVRGGPAFLGRRDLALPGSHLEEPEIWLLGPARARRWIAHSASPAVPLSSRAFPLGGYYVMRHQQGDAATYLVFDGGPFGDRRVPGHGHADALSLELYANGATFLVDPGVYGTQASLEWRNYFRGTRAHNTVVVDDLDQTILLDRRRVFRPAQTTVHRWWSDDQLDFVDASHNGYERLPQPVVHRRQVLFVKPDYWVVIDVLTGQGEHCFDLYYHLLPGQDIRLDPDLAVAQVGQAAGPGLAVAWLPGAGLTAEVVTGATVPIQGWVALYSGVKQPAPVLRLRQAGPAPVQFCTVLYPYPAGKAVPLRVCSLGASPSPGARVSAEDRLASLRIETRAYLDHLTVDLEPDSVLSRHTGRHSDGSLTFVRRARGTGHVLRSVRRQLSGGAPVAGHPG